MIINRPIAFVTLCPADTEDDELWPMSVLPDFDKPVCVWSAVRDASGKVVCDRGVLEGISTVRHLAQLLSGLRDTHQVFVPHARGVAGRLLYQYHLWQGGGTAPTWLSMFSNSDMCKVIDPVEQCNSPAIMTYADRCGWTTGRMRRLFFQSQKPFGNMHEALIMWLQLCEVLYKTPAI